MRNGTIATRMTPDPGLFEILHRFAELVEEKLLGFSAVMRADGEFAWSGNDHSAAVVFANPSAADGRRAIHQVAADVIHTLNLERGADTPPIALRVHIGVDTEGLRVSWRFCFLDTDVEARDA